MGQANPPVELFDFPCDYPFKVFTDAADRETFCQSLLTSVSVIVSAGKEHLQLRPSPKGNYVCVTLTVQVSSRQQIEQIYTVLRELEGVRYIL